MATDTKRRLSRSKIGYVGEDGVRPYAWNPFGCGCTGGCDGCYAWGLAWRGLFPCPKCNRFEVHAHPERLCEPANTKKPGVVLVNFTCDTFDGVRPVPDVYQMLDAARNARWHTYVYLTKQPENAEMLLEPRNRVLRDNEYLGCTIRHQQDADEKLPIFLQIPGNLWISDEPAAGPVKWGEALKCRGGGTFPIGLPRQPVPTTRWERSPVCGIIIGHDNRRNAPGTDTLDHIYNAIDQCVAASVNAYVKQIWHGGKLLRANHPDEYALFPEDLKIRELPWEEANA